ncbi:MAG TPA: hypothetical protein VGY53_01410, partial [Isosphaeraceae bacterium]|nr:hypothetical protein [Isosphaeraceae bacterium]
AQPLDRANPEVPPRTLWSMVLLLAIKKMATVVRFEPHRGKQALTYRKRGHYHLLMEPPRHMTLELIGEIESVMKTGGWRRKRPALFSWLQRPEDSNHDEEITKKCLVELKIRDQTVDAIMVVEPTVFSRSVIIYLVDSSPPFRTRSMASRIAARALRRIFSDWKTSKPQGRKKQKDGERKTEAEQSTEEPGLSPPE